MICGVMLCLVVAVMQEEQTFNIRKSITTNSNTFLKFISLIHFTFGWEQKVNRTCGAFFAPATVLRNCAWILLLEVLKHGCSTAVIRHF